MLRAYKIGIVFISFCSLFLIAAAIMPTKITVQRSLLIDANSSILFEQVNNLKNWQQWMYWLSADANINIQYSNITSGPNAEFEWWKNNDISGKVKIRESLTNKSVTTEIYNGNSAFSSEKWFFEESQEGTIVTLKRTFEISFPFNVFGPWQDEVIGPRFETALQGLKTFTAR